MRIVEVKGIEKVVKKIGVKLVAFPELGDFCFCKSCNICYLVRLHCSEN